MAVKKKTAIFYSQKPSMIKKREKQRRPKLKKIRADERLADDVSSTQTMLKKKWMNNDVVVLMFFFFLFFISQKLFFMLLVVKMTKSSAEFILFMCTYFFLRRHTVLTETRNKTRERENTKNRRKIIFSCTFSFARCFARFWQMMMVICYRCAQFWLHNLFAFISSRIFYFLFLFSLFLRLFIFFTIVCSRKAFCKRCKWHTIWNRIKL